MDMATHSMQWMTLILSGCFMLSIFVVLIWLIHRSRKQQSSENETAIEPADVVEPLQGVPQRRGPSSFLRRRQATMGIHTEANSTDEQSSSVTSSNTFLKKVKKKKQAHREAERERKEALAAAREAQKQKLERERELEEEKKLERQKQQGERMTALESIRKEKEEAENLEYQKWKSAIQLTEQGEEKVDDVADNPEMLSFFISYVVQNKVIVLEELAMEMGMKTEDVINRIQLLQESGHLSGVFDDRGKYIYISPEEMHSVSNFIKKKGRVSIRELAIESANLIQWPNE